MQNDLTQENIDLEIENIKENYFKIFFEDAETEDLREQFKAMGHGNRQFCNTDKFGFPKRKKDGTLEAPRERRSDYFGFKTGDLVKTTPTKRQPKQYIARIAACEKRGTMTIFINGKRIGYNHKKLIIVQKKDGYKYS
jgi:hypothetical protein